MKDNIDSPLADYKGSGYRRMNQIVRMGYPDNQDIFDIPALQSLMTKYHIPENIVVYRFVDIKELLILQFKTAFGRIYEYPQFLSTTLLKNEYSMDYIKKGRIVIEFQVEKGCHGAYLTEVVDENPEFEILFPHHTPVKRVGWKKYAVFNSRN